MDVALFDLTGKRVYSRMRMTGQSFDISVSDLAKGTYCVRISDEYRSKMKVLVIN